MIQLSFLGLAMQWQGALRHFRPAKGPIDPSQFSIP
jgi:hypothetical protein